MNSDFEACNGWRVILPVFFFLKQNNALFGGIAALDERWGSSVKQRILCLAKNFPL